MVIPPKAICQLEGALKIHKGEKHQFKNEENLEQANGALGWTMQHEFFISVYYGNGGYVRMELEDQEDHIKDEMRVRRRSS
jgi:hypothetical protein